MFAYLSAGIICSNKWTVFRQHSLRKTMSFQEQITSEDKYPSIFLGQMEAILFIILQIFFATCAVLKIGEYHSDIPQWEICSHETRVDQSRASENIWWIIIYSWCFPNSRVFLPGLRFTHVRENHQLIHTQCFLSIIPVQTKLYILPHPISHLTVRNLYYVLKRFTNTP